jgi:hypothetical protein
MANFSSNNERHSEKCQNCIYKHKYVISEEEKKELRMYAYSDRGNIASVEDYLQENQYAHN